MRDNHLHTYFSYDSSADFEDYLNHYDGDIVTTEHFDLSNPVSSGKDDCPDYEAYTKKVAELNYLYPNQIKKGIEVGYYAPREKDILAYLDGKSFDLKLLSVHHNGQFDYLDDEVADMDKMAIIKQYLDELIFAIGRVEADVLAHFDYGFRIFDVTVDDLKEVEPLLKTLFRKMMAHNLAFELNAKSMYLYHNESLYRYALTLLQELGCQHYSIGSDGHKLEHFRLHFDRISDLLAEYHISDSQVI